MSPDPKNTHTIAVVRPPAPFTANANIVVDTRDYVGKRAIVVSTAVATAGTSPTYDLYIQSTANSNGVGGTNASVSLTQVANTNSFQTLSVDLRGVRRYLTLVQVIGGSSSPNFAVGIASVGVKQVE